MNDKDTRTRQWHAITVLESDNSDESFILSPPSKLEESSSDIVRKTVPLHIRGKTSKQDIPRPLQVMGYSVHENRWAQMSDDARGTKEPLPSSVCLLTWNIDFASKNPKRRLAAGLEYIQQDVFKCKTATERPEPSCCILLQEVSARAFTVILAHEWVQRNFLVVPPSTDEWPRGATYGNVTLVSRTIPVCGAFTIDFSNSHMGRNGLFVDVRLAVQSPIHAPRLSGGLVQVRIGNTHLESLPQGARARPEQLRIIAESLQEHELHGGLVGGDMNAIGQSDRGMVEKVGLVDAWQGSDKEEGFTWGYQPESRYPPGRLDKVLWFARGGIEVEQPIRVGVGAKVGHGEWISDHYGLVTNVRVRQLPSVITTQPEGPLRDGVTMA